MKKILIAALAAIATLSFVSCQDFLETNPTSSVADNQVFTSIQGANAALNGCYNLLHFNDEGYGRGDVSGTTGNRFPNTKNVSFGVQITL